MATKFTDQYYEVSTTESIKFTITGPADPRVQLDTNKVDAHSGTPFTVTPQMLNGLGAVHAMNCFLVFPAGPADYVFSVDDQNGNVDGFTISGPDLGSFSKVQITIEVVGGGA